MPGAVVLVTSPEPDAVCDALRDASGVSSLLIVGDGAHLVVDDAARRVPELRARLEAARVRFTEVAGVVPTVEDVFVAWVGASGEGRP
jgi:hypothetical protein